ncbi:MAG: ABC transporter permease [Planctomycetota bacterium]|nr:ABC transporter permease [Planctomycetota bacterium]
MNEPLQEAPARTSPYRLAVAWRLLWTRRINLVSIVGVVLGIASIIVVMSVMDGFQEELRGMIRGTLSDIIVELDPRDVATEERYRRLKGAIEEIDGVSAVTSQQHTFGAIPGRNRAVNGALQKHMAVRIVGIRVADEARVSKVLDSVLDAPGQPKNAFEVELDDWVPSEMPRAIISAWMAKRLGGGLPLDVGDRFTLITFSEDKDDDGNQVFKMNSPEVLITRIYKSGNTDFDKLHIYVDLEGTGKELFDGHEGVVAELRIKLDDYRKAAAMRETIGNAIGVYDPAGYIQTWEERQSNLLRAVNNEKFLLAFVLFFIVVVACFTIFATLTMMVAEKTRDIGVLRALGATPGGIMSIFVLNGTLVGALGTALGYGLGMIVAHNVNPIRGFLREYFGVDIFPADIYLFDRIPTHIDHRAALVFAAGALFFALLFALIPAFRAGRLRPVRALRYE